MKALTAIKERRSCRNFLDKPVEKEKLETVLQAGLYAPSAVNKQPWEFIVSTNKQLHEQFKTASEQVVQKLAERSGWKWLNHYHVDFLTQAPVLIVVVGDPTKNGAEQFLDEPQEGYLEACSGAVQNMLLAAQAEGLGSLWYSLFERSQVAELFKVPTDKVAVAVICLGYAKGEGTMPRRQEFSEKVTYLK